MLKSSSHVSKISEKRSSFLIDFICILKKDNEEIIFYNLNYFNKVRVNFTALFKETASLIWYKTIYTYLRGLEVFKY